MLSIGLLGSARLLGTKKPGFLSEIEGFQQVFWWKNPVSRLGRTPNKETGFFKRD
jgi:hypothetical protein